MLEIVNNLKFIQIRISQTPPSLDMQIQIQTFSQSGSSPFALKYALPRGVLDGTSYPADFFYDEYELDYQIATLFERKKIVQAFSPFK